MQKSNINKNAMKKKILIRRILFVLLVIILLCLVDGKARSANFIELGFNQSKFRNERCISQPGLTLGLTKDFYPFRSFNGFIGLGINYRRTKFALEDRTWKSNNSENDFEIEKGDVNVNISYIDIDLNVGYSIKMTNQFSSDIYGGYSLSLPIKNHTKISNQRTIPLKPDERENYHVDYIPLDENHTIPSTNFQFGFRLSHNRFAIVIGYLRALSITEGVSSLSVEDKIDTYKITAAYIF